jgi:hypothetical protein
VDVSSIASLATHMSQERTGQEVGTAVLKMALDAQAGSAMALINALPPTAQNLPANLGQSVNTTA